MIRKFVTKWLLIFLTFSVPIIIAMIGYNVYTISLLRGQAIDSNQNLVSLYMDQIDAKLEQIDLALYHYLADNADLISLDVPIEVNPERYYLSKIKLYNQFSYNLAGETWRGGFFHYSVYNDDLLSIVDQSISYTDKLDLEKAIKLSMTADQNRVTEYMRQWSCLKVDEQYYLIHFMRNGSSFLGVAIRAESLLVDPQLLDLGEEGRMVLLTDQSQPLFDQDFYNQLTEKGAFLLNKKEISSMELGGVNNQFLVVGEASKLGEFQLMAFIQDKLILKKLPFIQSMLLISYLLLVLIFSGLYFIFSRKLIIKPINEMMKGMSKVRDGQLDSSVIYRSNTMEFDSMIESFNQMLERIKNLKIQVYEEKISKKNAELKQLQMQINPHFFLNSINMIYQLAVTQSYHLIKEMSLCLIEYFRFMYRERGPFILLDEEIQHTINYLHIQEMRFEGYLTHEIELIDGLSKYMIPPLIIQNFVENAIKYGVNMDEMIVIKIEVDIVGSLDCPEVKIRVSDNGIGYPPEIIRILRSGNLDALLPDHVGIWNTEQRLKYIYGDKAKMKFDNSESKGANVEIYLPLSIDELIEGIKDNEYFTCGR